MQDKTFDINTWPVAGHKKVIDKLNKLITKNQLPQAIIFSGASNIGKTYVARNIIKTIQCESDKRPCGVCSSCLGIDNNIHPDVIIKDGILKISDVRKIKHKFALSASSSPYKICLIANADKMTMEAANALLKIIEEPIGKAIIILTVKSVENLLATILSRCFLFKFSVPSINEIERYFYSYHKKTNADFVKEMISNFGNKPGIIFSLLKNKNKLNGINEAKDDLKFILDNTYLNGRLGLVSKFAKKENDELKGILGIWKLCLRNSILNKLEILPVNKNLLSGCNLKQIADRISNIDRTTLFLDRNINKKLLLENLIINF